MQALPLRLVPGDDLRAAIEAAVAAHGGSAFVVSGIGSLGSARIRFAGRDDAETLAGASEIVSLAGSVAGGAAHLHAVLADESGRVVGGHVAAGCIVRTTAEVLLALLPEWELGREADERTGYAELVVRRR